jgi:hypothetical protein
MFSLNPDPSTPPSQTLLFVASRALSLRPAHPGLDPGAAPDGAAIANIKLSLGKPAAHGFIILAVRFSI